MVLKPEGVSDVSWVASELSGVRFGDKRLENRLRAVGCDLYSHPGASLNKACGDWACAKAAYRLFSNEKVCADEILSAHFSQTSVRMSAHKRVFAIQDTTYLDYTSHKATQDLGPISTRVAPLSGLVKHTTLVVSECGIPLGCLADSVWVRASKSVKGKKDRPISEKESFKWLGALREIKARSPSEVEVISIGDRESDVYEFLYEARDVPYVIRAAQNRRVDSAFGTLKALVESRPVSGEFVLEVPKRGSQPGRPATLSVHWTPAKLKPPQRSKAASAEPLLSVEVHVVWVVEKHPPKGVSPLQWLLLTSVPVASYEDARERVLWYKQRWHIEVYFKVLKSGTKVEAARLQTKDRLLPYIALQSVIAWRLYWMTHVNRQAPEAPCTEVLTEIEWKALYCKTHKTRVFPAECPSVGEVVVWIAKLGGFLGRKSDGVPGVMTLWRGWQRLSDIADTFALFHTDAENAENDSR